MIDTIIGIFVELFTFLKNLFVILWNILVGIAEFIGAIINGLYAMIVEGQDFMQEVLPNALKWMWENWLQPLMTAIMSTVENDFRFTDYLSGIPFVDIMVNNYVTHFVNVDLVVASFSAACLFMGTLAFAKFCMKRIPLIGG